jgi:imidazolonepropionase-like amidohydrolase
MRILLSLLLVISVGSALWAQAVSKAQPGVFALTNARLVTVTQGVVENGSLLIRDGRIAQLGTNIDIPANARVIDCRGQSVYPGFIDGGTKLGLGEIGSISLTQDANEVGDIVPHMKALTAVNPNSVAIPVTRVNGMTTVLTVPQGGLFPGQAALINLLGYTPDQMYAGFQGVVLRYPASGRRGRRDRRSEEERKKEEEKALKQLNELWEQAVLYARIDSAARAGAAVQAEPNPPLQVLAPVVRGEATLLVEVDKEKDILSALRWVKEKKIERVVFTGLQEGWRVADSLTAARMPVIAGPVQSTPSRSSDRYDTPYTNPAKMQQAGLLLALRTDETENVRNLPFHAGFAAAYGLGKEEALKAVTINPARIFGLADQLGSLEEGKVANLFVCDGDPFETKTQISHLFISGFRVPLDSRHIRLYNEFLERQPGLKK